MQGRVERDVPRKRVRLFAGIGGGASGFMKNVPIATTASSKFLSTKPADLTQPFVFGKPLLRAVQTRAWVYEGTGGSTTLLSGAPGPRSDKEELEDILRKPFHGVSLDHAKRKVRELDPVPFQDDAPAAVGDEQEPADKRKDAAPSLTKRIRKLWARYDDASGFYERVENAALGVRIQLLHRPGEFCEFRSLHAVENFTIVHTNGIHTLPVDFCGCDLGRHVPRHIQLMRWRFWPATCVNPQTATTFEALDLFHRLTLLGRLNVYDFYRALEAATDGAMLKGIASVRQQVSNCVRQFRHILMFKRAGRGHEPGGIAGTPPGGAAVQCPACPNFDMNVPADWALSPFRWLYRVILALDANFRLANKLTRSTTQTDPNLTDGRAYMAPWDDYTAYLCETDKELNEQYGDCSRFGAIFLANMKGGKGLRTTGVAGCFCARHEFVQPLGLATMRLGERFNVMDYVLCGALTFIRAAELTISYDVTCQYAKKISERLSRIRVARVVWAGAQRFFALAHDGAVTYVVPKFHLYAHKIWCQIRLAFMWLCGTGLTDGETPERVWAGANPAASSLREMGPGGMNDVMDDMAGAWNWQKVCGIAKALIERMERALDEGATQTAIHTELTEALEEQDAPRVQAERDRIAFWNACDQLKTRDKFCPYYAEKQKLSVAQIRLETEQAVGSAAYVAAQGRPDNEVELAKFLLQGLQIEDDRARITSKHREDDGTIKQATSRTQVMNNLVRSILRFREDQEHTMPAVYAALTSEERDPDRQVALTVNLCMPSSPPAKDKTLVSAAASAMEAKLRWASMVDELDNLLHQLRLKGCLNKFKLANITGQRACTRARTAQDAVDANVKRAADAYRRHRKAYLALVGEGKWEDTMRVLVDSDCRALGDRLLEQMDEMSEYNVTQFLAGRGNAKRSGDTHYELPWIWFNATPESGLQITEELMVEWSKCRARAIHWVEEVRLLDAEMQRVLDFNESMARIWDNRTAPETTIVLGEDDAAWGQDDAWADGVRAYARKQAHIRRAQAELWRKQFVEYRKDAQRFLAVHTSDGMSIEPLTMLSPDEAEDMMARAGRRKEKLAKGKRAKRSLYEGEVAWENALDKAANQEETADADAMAISAPAAPARTKGKRSTKAAASQSTEEGATVKAKRKPRAVKSKRKAKM
ncbi:hypothetical protein PENSPDRAFT_693448 [Peniophora sp. CONT]|nr:hypothetical protein PENSPDRAFT_693448 [Peniophora sp. CONT]